MGTHLAPIHRKPLVDPAACGVRLGIELRAAAEQLAWNEGLCLSHWIKRLVEGFVAKANQEAGADFKEHEKASVDARAEDEPFASHKRTKIKTGNNISESIFQRKDVVESALDVAFAEEMEKLNT